MNYHEFTAEIKRRIPKMPYVKQLELAVIICNRLLPEYQKFSQTYQWGNPALLADAIKICTQALYEKPNVSQIKSLLPEVDKIAPHMDDFGDFMGSYALNASGSVYETLQFITNSESRCILDVVTFYTDTIDFKIQEEQDGITDDEIDGHPLMAEARSFLLEKTK